MKVRNNGRKRAAFILLLLVWLLWIMPFTVYATEVNEDLTNEVDESNNNRFSADSPWLDQADDSIYSNPIDAGEEDSTIDRPNRVPWKNIFQNLSVMHLAV